ncbi:MAG TPA: prepilin peptidase [Gemmataceae bacterium]|nr:prepilin peptidase [Gemmataceae bacterium]
MWIVNVPWYIWLPPIFILGATVGSFLNVCIHRLPLEKSLIWPAGSRCSHCLQAIRWYDNLPLISYWLLRGRCRTCQAPFSIRYFFIELLTAVGFVGLFYLEVVRNVGNLDPLILEATRYDKGRLVLFAYHAILFSFLLVASVCDLDYQIIPFSLTISGTVVGLIGSMLMPWPWPYTPAEAVRDFNPSLPLAFQVLKTGAYPWPLCWPLPSWLGPGGTWLSGLATGLAGVLAGTLALRAVRFLFGFGRGAEYMEPEDPEWEEVPRTTFGRWFSWFQRVGGKAMGLGDADLMMMAGSFLGWQIILVAFIIGVIPGLFLGLVQLVLRGNQPFPFGPALAIGVIITWLNWARIGPHVQILFFDSTLFLIMGGFGAFFMAAAGFFLRFLHGLRT